MRMRKIILQPVNCVTSDSIDLMQIVKSLEIHLGQRCLVIL